MNHLTTLTLPLLASGLLAQGTLEVEPNDNPAAATALALGRQGDAQIGAAGDVDFWRVRLTTNSDLQLWINPGVGASLADSDLALIAPDGTTVLAFNDDSTAPASLLSTIVAGNLVAGNYYLRVRSSQAADPSGTGTYTIDVVAAPPGSYLLAGGGSPGIPTPITEGPEDNDPRLPAGAATSSLINSVNFGEISAATVGTGFADPGADYDFYEINVTRAGLLTLETLPIAAAPAMSDTVVYLVSQGLTPIAFDDDGGSGQLSLLSYYITPSTYLVAVKGQDTGNYVLDIELTPMAASGAASVTVQPGGCGPTLTVRQTVAGPTLETELCILGSAYYLDAANLPPNTTLLHVIGTESLGVPYDLGPLGAPGCFLEVEPLDQSPATASSAGTYHWALYTPIKLWLIGLTLEQQIAVVDPNANALGMTMTNRVSSVCGVHH